MLLQDGDDLHHTTRSRNPHRFRRINIFCLENRRIAAAGRRLEAVSKARHEAVTGARVEPHRHPSFHRVGDRSQVVDAMRMIGMVVGIKHAVERLETDRKELLPNIRPSVDEDFRGALGTDLLDESRTTSAPVFWIARITAAPIVAEAWNTSGRAAAEDRQTMPHAASAADAARGTFLNNRKKFSVVALANSCGVTPLIR